MQPLRYDPVNDFAPITLMTRSPNLVVVHPSVAARSIKELIAGEVQIMCAFGRRFRPGSRLRE